MLCDSIYCPIIVHVGMFSWVALVAFSHTQLCWNFSKTFCWSQLGNCSCLIQSTHHKCKTYLMSHRSLVYSSVASFLLSFMYSFWVFFFFLKECKIRCQQALSYAIWVWSEMNSPWWTRGEGWQLAPKGFYPAPSLLTTEGNIRCPQRCRHRCMIHDRRLVQPATHEKRFSTHLSKRSRGQQNVWENSLP